MTPQKALLLLSIASLVAAGCATGPRKAALAGAEFPYPSKTERKAEEIIHLPTGLSLSFDGAMDMISAARLVCIGETHDNIHAHRVQLAIIRELHRRFPGKVAIGMEMFREPQQEALDRWTRGEMDELEFLKASKWHANWGSDFGNYRDILNFAKENGIDVLALNPSRDLEREVSRAGLDNVPDDLKAKLPGIGEIDPYQRAAMKAVYGAHMPSEGAFEAFLRVQVLWEEAMAERIVGYLDGPRGDGKTMVTLTGGWHVRYGFGIPKKVVRRKPMAYTIVAPEELSIPEDKKDQQMDISLPPIPLHAGDFAWMVPYEDIAGDRMRMGVRIAEKDGKVVVEGVEEGSPAEKAGIRAGSEFVTFDGHEVTDMTDVFHFVGAKKEGDTAEIVLRRDGVEESSTLTFFKMGKAKPH